MSSAFSPTLGERIAGRFELKAPLRGSGGTRTFLALDHQTGRDVALSLFHPGSSNPNTWAAFAQVVAAAAKAQVSGLVLPQNVSTIAPIPPYCLADLQVARGLDRLREQEGLIPWERALSFGERITEILHNVQAATGIAHRALLPSRCVVTVRDEIRILDYGVAEFEVAGSQQEDSGYRAPEQQGSTGDQRSDVYSLAVILYELISGQRPAAPSPPRLRSLVPVSFSVDNFMAKALAQDPTQRHTDLAAMRAVLRELLGLGVTPPIEPAKPPPAAAPSPTQAGVPHLPGNQTPVFPVTPSIHAARDEGKQPLPVAPLRAPMLGLGDKPRAPVLLDDRTEVLPVAPPLRPQSNLVPISSKVPEPINESGRKPPGQAFIVLGPKPAPVDLPTERVVRAEAAPAAITPSITASEAAARAKFIDELPTMVKLSANRAPRSVSPTPPAGTGVPNFALGPPADRTEVVGQPVVSSLPKDRTEVLNCLPAGATADKTEVLQQQPPMGSLEVSTLVLSETDVSSPPAPKGSPTTENSRTFSGPESAPPEPSKAWTVQKRLIVLNLVFGAVILCSLFIKAILQ